MIFIFISIINAQPPKKFTKKMKQDVSNISKTSHTFTKIAKKVIPSVVSINSTIIIRTNEIWKDQFNDNNIDEILEDQMTKLSVPKEIRQKGSGSGIIFSDKGYILTNVHVIENAEDVKVTLNDNRTYNANIIGIDPLTEIAVIKIDANNIPAATLGNSDSCDIGEWVLAIGNPLELSSTVTAGIVSAKERDINIIGDTYGVENFIQTDAAINPGNSGGPLVNLNGDVIGITTAIATENGYNQGYGFAIPINLAKEILDDLILNGHVKRAYLGISMQDIDEKKAKALNLKKPLGVFVDFVIEDGPAHNAGIRSKDVIIKINNEVVNKANIVQSVIAKKNPNDKIKLTIVRKNRISHFNVLLGERQYSIKIPPIKKSNDTFQHLGITVEQLTTKFVGGLPTNNKQGVLVTEIVRYSPAYEAKIKINDLILEIGDQPIYNKYILYTITESLNQGDVIIVKIKRGNTIFHTFVEKTY